MDRRAQIGLVIPVLILFCMSSPAKAVRRVEFTNGFASGSYETCGDFNSPGHGDDSCLAPTYFAWPLADTDLCGTSLTSATGDAYNFSGGLGGKGVRKFHETGAGGSATPYVAFDAADQVIEFWLGFYYRRSLGGCTDGKIWHIFNTFHDSHHDGKLAMSVSDNTDCMQVYMYSGEKTPRDPQGSGVCNSWIKTAGIGPSWDGNWHWIEMHTVMDSVNQTDGFIEWWIDGVHLGQRGSLGYCINDGTPCYFTNVEILQSPHSCSACDEWEDLDDFKVALPTYTGFVQDAQGHPMIGPIGWNSGTPGEGSGGTDVGDDETGGGGCFISILNWDAAKP